MPASLDMSLDEVIEASSGGKVKGRGKGKGKAKGRDAGRESGGRESGGKAANLDMSLDEIVEKSWSGERSQGNSKGWGQGKDNWSDNSASWGSKSAQPWVQKSGGNGFDKGWDKSSGKGYGKSTNNGKGKGSGASGWGDTGGSNYKPAWLEHDDWRGGDEGDAEESSWQPVGKGGAGRGRGKGGKGGGDDDWRGPGRGAMSQSWGAAPAPARRSWGDDSWGGGQGYEERGRPLAAPVRREGGALAQRLMREGLTSRSGPASGARMGVSASRPGAASTGSWQRIEQDDDYEPRRPARPAARAPAPAVGQKRKLPTRRDEDDEEEEEDRRPRAKIAKTAPKPAPKAVKRIKVTNVPKELKARDVREAFEAEAGKAESCSLEKGTAFIVFLRAEDARKAVETFDKGELNGKIISVALDP